MGLTLIALLTAAMLLPGIVATHQFYAAAESAEAEVWVPPLTKASGIALVGGFSVGVHLLFIVILAVTAQWPPLTPLLLADPYRFIGHLPSNFNYLHALQLLGGLSILILTAIPVGRLTAAAMLEKGDPATFYGPMTEIIALSKGDDTFVTAFVISKISHEKKVLGYQGVIASMIPDENRMPAKLVMRNVRSFYLRLSKSGPVRVETGQDLDWLTLNCDEWSNIAFKVYRVVDVDMGPKMVFDTASDYVNWQRRSPNEAKELSMKRANSLPTPV